MSGLIVWLEELSSKDSGVRATLRRSLAFDPGGFPPAYPYVEPFVAEGESEWRRKMLYLVAGLWAEHWREGRSSAEMTFGKACAAYRDVSRSGSAERRFINLLDADREQLPHRLRQMSALLKDQEIDFDDLLKGLLYWNDDRKRTQSAWARDFYRSLNTETEAERASQEEVPS